MHKQAILFKLSDNLSVIILVFKSRIAEGPRPAIILKPYVLQIRIFQTMTILMLPAAFKGKKRSILLFLGILMIFSARQLSGQSFYISLRSDGPTNICQGDPVTLILSVFGGNDPFTVVINDNDGEFMELKDIDMPYTFEIFPEQDNKYYIASAYDRRNRPGTVWGNPVSVEVYPSTPVSILMDRTAFLVTESGVPLESDPSGATFSGIGVSGSTFYPKVATTAGSPHLLTCTFENQWGCISNDTEDLYVLSGESSVSLVSGGEPVYSFCNDGSSYTIIGSNEDNLHGSFALYEQGSSTPVTGQITDPDPDDDRATLLTEGLSGEYDIVYTYGIGGLEIEASTSFIVLDVGLTGIRDLPETACKGDDPYPLIPEVSDPDPGASFTFSGPGVSGNQADGYFFDPGNQEVPLEQIEIRLDYTASNGCALESSVFILVGESPDVSFSLEPVCMDPQGGMVYFENLTVPKGSVVSWEWNFGDPSSGDNNSSDLENPDHFYTSPGPRTITLTATSFEGCSGQSGIDTLFVDHPVAEFTFSSDCFADGQSIFMIAGPVSEFADLDTMVWTIRTGEGDLLDEIGKGPLDDTLEYSFPSADIFDVNLYVENETGCAGEITKSIELFSLYTVTATGYLETFDQTVNDWSVASSDQLESWRLGEPDFRDFQPVKSDRAWYTDLPEYKEGVIEHSWVRSPCFDFSGLRNPVIGMDIMKSFEPDHGGAVLQYQESVGGPWQTLGVPGGGTNWYNKSDILYLPGGSSTGWGLETFEPDTEWLPASHPGNQLARKSRIKFRIAFASGGSKEIAPGVYNQGFAFDNFSISESMHRRSVLEYFTNAAGEIIQAADSMVNHFAIKHTGIVYDIHYHMNYPQEDPMYLYNPFAPSTRAFNYGIPDVPYAVLNGGVTPEYRYTLDPPDGELDDALLIESALENPDFDLSLSVDFQADKLDGSVLVTCMNDSVEYSVQLYVVVLESKVTAYPHLNQEGFRNVVVDMIPSPTGKLLGNNWNDGSTAEYQFEWEYVPYVEDPEDLYLVAFVQDRDQGWVLQADAAYHSPLSGIDGYESISRSMVLYPNPARDLATVYFGEVTGPDDILEIVDISGRKIVVSGLRQGMMSVELDFSGIPEGFFMIFWKQSGSLKDHVRFIRVR